MNDQSSTPPAARQRILRPRRLALLASAGALGLAVLAAGPSGYLPSGVAALTSAAHAESAPNTAGFADLVAGINLRSDDRCRRQPRSCCSPLLRCPFSPDRAPRLRSIRSTWRGGG